MHMKALALATILCTFFGLATAAVAAPSAVPTVDELKDARHAGIAVFADAGLGTNGKSCIECHAPSHFAGKKPFPKIAMGKVRTLDQAMQTCIVNALQGKALAWDDERLTALSVYVWTLYPPDVAKPGPDKEQP
jgi:mono/diheme cytochrome c family protein